MLICDFLKIIKDGAKKLLLVKNKKKYHVR